MVNGNPEVSFRSLGLDKLPRIHDPVRVEFPDKISQHMHAQRSFFRSEIR
jgi:hypothetical protein